MKIKIFLFFTFIGYYGFAQHKIEGNVWTDKQGVAFANVFIKTLNKGATTNENGTYKLENVPAGEYTIYVSFIGYKTEVKKIKVESSINNFDFKLKELTMLNEVVVTGTLKPISRLETAVPVEVYTTTFLKKNPTPNIFEALQNVNGVRPQLNCNICNTGDIHINGLEGPYTMVTIDGMPIVSGLSTVYGLTGIPNSLIDRIEIVKGPASSLYGSEAVGGLINIITKKAENAPLFFADFFTTSWLENNVDIGTKYNVGKNITSLLGLNYFNFNQRIDNNKDNFTDVTLQNRISVFNKYDFKRKKDREMSLAGRFFYEDRWGGEMQWNKSYRGGNEVYGESIYTKRFEIIGKYQLPLTEKINTSFSYVNHDQNSVYGETKYIANQKIAFAQATWDKKINANDILIGAAFRHQFYDDNTPATESTNKSDISSFFAQNEISFKDNKSLLLGTRFDYKSNNGAIFTPRIAYKWKPTENDVFRVNAGTGFRIVNLFTEEHAALTGARDVIISENLDPEKSYNINANYLKKYKLNNGARAALDVTGWYTYFNNQILPDYDTNPNQIIYANLNGFSNTYGITVNGEFIFPFGLKTNLGFTLLESKNKRNGIVSTPILTEKFSATWDASMDFPLANLTLDYTANLYGPMRLALLGELDPRREYSPFWSLQNLQATYKKWGAIELYGGVKNILNWTPNRNNAFLIARTNDPFDNEVTFNQNGDAIATTNNPYALTFDPTYMFAPNQGRRFFLGLRFRLD